MCLRAVGLDDLGMLLRSLCDCGVRTNCTGFDVAFDTQSFSVQDVVDAHNGGLLDCRASVFREMVGAAGRRARPGTPCTSAPRSSEAMLRIYYKTDGHSFREAWFAAVELELGERASFHFMELMANAMTDWGHVEGAWLSASFRSVRNGGRRLLRVSKPSGCVCGVRRKRWNGWANGCVNRLRRRWHVT